MVALVLESLTRCAGFGTGAGTARSSTVSLVTSRTVRASSSRLFGYVRYNAELTREGLDHLGLSDVRPEDVQRLDSVEQIGDLRRIGMSAALEVDGDHFTEFVEPQAG